MNRCPHGREGGPHDSRDPRDWCELCGHGVGARLHAPGDADEFKPLCGRIIHKRDAMNRDHVVGAKDVQFTNCPGCLWLLGDEIKKAG